MMMVMSTVMLVVPVVAMIVNVVVPSVVVPHGNDLLVVVVFFVSVGAAKTHLDGVDDVDGLTFRKLYTRMRFGLENNLTFSGV
jgi:hypothetical protein